MSGIKRFWAGSVSLLLAGVFTGCTSKPESGPSGGPVAGKKIQLLNVSNDPTRELWKELDETFTEEYKSPNGGTVEIKQSHGGSSSQARAVIDGLDADLVSLAMWYDVDAISRAGLISKSWEERLPNKSCPYNSLIVFVVRKGNPKQIKDWPDLAKEGVEVITPNPKTSGNGKLSFLGAWGSVLKRGGNADQAKELVSKLYAHTPVLDTAARAATTTFAQKKIGDVHLTWEGEAHLEVQESKGELEIVYPPLTIKVDLPVALVDTNVEKKGSGAAVDAFLRFLYTDKAQEIFAKHWYRPYKQEILAKHAESLPIVETFQLEDIEKSWDDAAAHFFAEGALFDQIYAEKAKK